MLGTAVYRLTVYRFGFLFGHVIFLLGYAYLSGVLLQFLLSGAEKIYFHPLYVWQNLLNHWQHWSAHKDQLELKIWFHLFAAAIFPFFFFTVIEKLIVLLLWPIRAYRRKRLAKQLASQPKVMTAEEHMENIEAKLDALKEEMDHMQHPEEAKEAVDTIEQEIKKEQKPEEKSD